jgi:acetylornithine deacetylase
VSGLADPADLLLELVRTPSVSGDEAACAALARDWFAARQIDVELVGQSVLACVELGPGPRLLLNSHLDTVPAGPSWTVDPWDARWDGERLTGLGANDAKAAAAGMMTALAALAERRDARGTAWLALCACEETTNAGMRDVLAVIGRPDAGITGEPTGLEVVRAQSGLAVLVARWRGKSCHAAHVARVEHENALLRAAREVAAFPSALLLDGVHPLLGPSTIAATVLRAGDRHNRVPDEAELLLDARLAPPHDAAECLELLAQLLPGAELSVRSERLRAVETPAEHPLVRCALAAAHKEQAIGSSTMSDMALLAGVAAVKCGPGLTARSHTPDEFVLRAEVLAGAHFYTRVLPSALAALQEVPS